MTLVATFADMVLYLDNIENYSISLVEEVFLICFKSKDNKCMLSFKVSSKVFIHNLVISSEGNEKS